MTPDIKDQFERALEEILARVFPSGVGGAVPPALAVAYSGGLDSTVLLHLVHDWVSARKMSLQAFHVHHGLSTQADAWSAHCEAECTRLGVPFDMRRVQVNAGAEGVEQAARRARYAALGEMCGQHGAALLLTAHHLDDQAETVLLQLLRGAGIAGLSGMELANNAPALLGNSSAWLARPLLGVTREQLRRYARNAGLTWVEDDSNTDARFSRNRLRHTAMPLLEQGFPGYQTRLARAAGHAAAAQELLEELAAQDLRECGSEGGLDLCRLQGLSVARFNNLLRHWFSVHAIRMPSSAWLGQLRLQAFAAADAQVRVTHPDCEVWRYRGRLLLAPRIEEAVLQAPPALFTWQGEPELHFPAFCGRLLFEPTEEGVDANWLHGRALVLRHRRGGDRLSLGVKRPTRDLKHQFQSLAVPPWERRRLPVIADNASILYAAGIGLNWAVAPIVHTGGIALRWLPASAG